MIVITRLSGRFLNGKLKLEEVAWSEDAGRVAYAKGETTNEVVPTGPWEGQVPYLQQLFAQASQLMNQPAPQYPSGPTVATSPTLTQNQNDIMGFIQNSQPMLNAATNTAAANATTANPTTAAAQPLVNPMQSGILSLLMGQNPSLNFGQTLAPQAGQSLTQNLNLGTPDTAPAGTSANSLLPQYQQTIGSILQGTNAASTLGQNTAGGAESAINRALAPPTAGYNASGAPVNPLGNLDIGSELQASLSGGALNPFLDQVVQGATRSATRQFQDTVIPGIRDAAMAAGQRGGTSEGVARGIAASRMNEDISDIVTNLFSNAFNQGAAERSQALNIGANAAGQNAGLNLQTAQLNEAIRAGQAGEGLTASQQVLQGLLGNTQSQLTAANNITGTGLDAARIQEAGRGTNLQTGLNASNMILQQLLGGSELGLNAIGQGAGLTGDLLSTGTSQGIQQLFNSLNLIPSLQNAGLNQLGVGNQVGLQQLGQNQAQIDSDIAKFFFEQFAPYAQLAQFQNFITGSYGSSV